MASVRAAPAVAVSRVMRLTNISLLPVIPSSAVEQRQHAGDEEEDDIHDAERKASLQHAALFIGSEMQAVDRRITKDAEVDLVRLSGHHAGAVLVCDAAQFVDTCDQCADKAQVDEGDEACVVARPVVGEERSDGPGGAEHADDEEHEDVGRC